jgi:hypothetical protein
MRKNFTFKKKKSHKLLFSIVAILSMTAISILAYSSFAETEEDPYKALERTSKKMYCEIVYSIPDEELKIEFGEDTPPREYGVIRRCENPEIVCYYIGGTRNIFCQFKRFDKIRVKGNLRPE